ncbi:hypothetical protein JYG33_03275 [Alcaligenes sp. SORT26]|uniref:hypothetical protein n=1 Tax=Alcaligenes sp. SORT26 TaxID=2813780 RepID=UPI001A9E6B01|nr:hypothetical protein [Alcaligenes sp. SORT26]QTC00502.1 hypothetical protein JYG33_03275 [Alcaligenes sp. SORT26]
MQKLSGDDLLWNWARWCWSGETVGNMERYVPWEDDYRPINQDHAEAVNILYQCLPLYQAMVVQAEYTRKNSHFGNLSASERLVVARRWIRQITGAILRDEDYKRHLKGFRAKVEKEVLL